MVVFAAAGDVIIVVVVGAVAAAGDVIIVVVVGAVAAAVVCMVCIHSRAWIVVACTAVAAAACTVHLLQLSSVSLLSSFFCCGVILCILCLVSYAISPTHAVTR